ncbi:ABC transporter substrate-binding protein [Nonomuraea sp. B10E15]|uniref:ABC transporter substrate-binding protein n=1 Tax=Nonomuraea sp. B10E15 TaxID=3153560 RepID=UPI00325CF5E4
MTSQVIGVPLALTGRFARFGEQARLGLEVWRAAADGVELVVEDDRSDPDVLERVLRGLAGRCDLLLGPYSTHLMRRAGRVAAELDLLVWNHGGAGDDVQGAHPGHVVSVLAPASAYAEPFVRRLAEEGERDRLWVVPGKGSFGRQVAAGAERAANERGIPVIVAEPGAALPVGGSWNLLCCGSFEEDVEVLRRASNPRMVCAVAAGVRAFGEAVGDPYGIYGIGQWFPSEGEADSRDRATVESEASCEREAAVGMSEREFVTTYRERAGVVPDYVAVQAVAAAVVATHCAMLAGSTGRAALWGVATALETTTLLGAFRVDPGSGAQVGHRAALTRWP